MLNVYASGYKFYRKDNGVKYPKPIETLRGDLSRIEQEQKRLKTWFNSNQAKLKDYEKLDHYSKVIRLEKAKSEIHARGVRL